MSGLRSGWATAGGVPPVSKEIFALFDRYVHGIDGRADFLARVAPLAPPGVTALEVLQALEPVFERARVDPGDGRIAAQSVQFSSPNGYGNCRAYVVRPSGSSRKLPGVLVIHENRGLNPHIEDVARRLALEGFLALAPDALFPLGGYPGDEDAARALFANLDPGKTRQDFIAAAQWLMSHADCTGKAGVIGFCWGGAMAHFLATRLAGLRAAVPFYGPAPAPDQAPHVRAALLVHLAEHDDRVNGTWPPYEAALTAAGVDFQVFRYPGTQHGFHNDTTPRYDAAAAGLAWQRSIAFLQRLLQEP